MGGSQGNTVMISESNGSSLSNFQMNQNPVVRNIMNPASMQLTQQMNQTINPQYAYPVYLIVPVQRVPMFGFHL